MLSFIAKSDVTSWRRFETRRTLGRLVILEELGAKNREVEEYEVGDLRLMAKYLDIHCHRLPLGPL